MFILVDCQWRRHRRPRYLHYPNSEPTRGSARQDKSDAAGILIDAESVNKLSPECLKSDDLKGREK
jgi:hypothetical protein